MESKIMLYTRYDVKIFFYITLLIQLLASCGVAKIQLSKEELELQKYHREKQSCDSLEFVHDYQAIVNNSSNGLFCVGLCNSFCSKDNQELCEIAIEIAEKLTPILTHKENYAYIVFLTSRTEQIDKITSKQVCSKVIKISISEPDKIYSIE